MAAMLFWSKVLNIDSHDCQKLSLYDLHKQTQFTWTICITQRCSRPDTLRHRDLICMSIPGCQSHIIADALAL